MQPADVGWFKSLKLSYKKDWNEWFLHGTKYTTRFGNIAGPGYQNMLSWISKGWKEFNIADVIYSFQYCGITSDSDHDYHSELKELVVEGKLPPNITIDIRAEHEDPELAGAFVNAPEYLDDGDVENKEDEEEKQDEDEPMAEDEYDDCSELEELKQLDDDNHDSNESDSENDESTLISNEPTQLKKTTKQTKRKATLEPVKRAKKAKTSDLPSTSTEKTLKETKKRGRKRKETGEKGNSK